MDALIGPIHYAKAEREIEIAQGTSIKLKHFPTWRIFKYALGKRHPFWNILAFR
jgi:hypothetical protein